MVVPSLCLLGNACVVASAFMLSTISLCCVVDGLFGESSGISVVGTSSFALLGFSDWDVRCVCKYNSKYAEYEGGYFSTETGQTLIASFFGKSRATPLTLNL
jgi:hypothetical protein